MSEEQGSESSDDLAGVDRAALARLEAEVTDLRLQIGEGVRTRQLVVVDDAGVARARIVATSGGDCRFVLFDEDGFERIRILGKPDIGVIAVSGRSRDGEPTRVEMFAHDPVEADGCHVGVHLVDRGNAVAGMDVLEGHPAHVWT